MKPALKLLTVLNRYGPQLVADPQFDTPSRWTSGNEALWWTVSGGRANFLNNELGWLRPADGFEVPLIAGQLYELRYTVVGATEGANAARVALFNQAGSEAFVTYATTTTNGERVFTFRPAAAATNVRIYSLVSAGVFSLENFSIRRRVG